MAGSVSVVIGGDGFIGSNIVSCLLAEGRRVIVIDKASAVASGAAPRNVDCSADLRRIRHDLAQPLPRSLIDDADVGEIFHLAASVGVEEVSAAPAVTLRNNLIACLNALDWAVATGCPKFVFASTSETYASTIEAGLAGFPTDEDVPLVVSPAFTPRSSYAVSKIAGEQACLAYEFQYGVQISIVRYHNVYGPNMGAKHVIPQLIQRVLRRDDPIVLLGNGRRCFCHVRDAAFATVKIAHTEPLASKILNIGNPAEEVEISDLARRILECAGHKASLELRPGPIGSPQRRVPDIAKLVQEIGFQPRISLDEGLDETVTWYREHLADAGAGCAHA